MSTFQRCVDLPCVTIIAAVSSLPADIRSRIRGIVCVLTRPIESAVSRREEHNGQRTIDTTLRLSGRKKYRRLTSPPRPQPINLQLHRRRVHAYISYRPTFAYQRLTHVERRWDADGFHHDVEAVGLRVEVSACEGADRGDDVPGRSDVTGVDGVRVGAGEHAFCEREASVREVEECYAARGVEG